MTSEQKARLVDYCERSGLDEQAAIREAVEQFLNDSRFAGAVARGFAEIDRGDFLDHEAVGQRLDRYLKH